MTYFTNLHSLPTRKHAFTLAVTTAEPGTPLDRVEYDEVDVVADRMSTVEQVIAAADLSDYEPCTVLAVIDHSAGYTMYDMSETHTTVPRDPKTVCAWCGETDNDEQGALDVYDDGLFHEDCANTYFRHVATGR